MWTFSGVLVITLQQPPHPTGKDPKMNKKKKETRKQQSQIPKHRHNGIKKISQLVCKTPTKPLLFRRCRSTVAPWTIIAASRICKLQKQKNYSQASIFLTKLCKIFISIWDNTLKQHKKKQQLKTSTRLMTIM